MSNTINLTAARLQNQVPATEARIDDALIAVSTLMTNVVTARRDTPGVPPIKGQSTIHRIARLQTVLVGASGDALRIHGELADWSREYETAEPVRTALPGLEGADRSLDAERAPEPTLDPSATTTDASEGKLP